MNKHAHGFHRAASAALALGLLALLALLSACGPGVGGTGTGAAAIPVAVISDDGSSVGVAAVDNPPSFDLQAWQATPADVCATPLGAALACQAALPDAGTGALYLGDSAGPGATGNGQQVVVAVASNTVALRQGCPALSFTGLWAESGPARKAAWYGSVTQNGVSAPAALSAQASPGGALAVTLTDTSGRLLLGPLTLLPIAAPLAPAACR